jgi:hypothetical protein
MMREQFLALRVDQPKYETVETPAGLLYVKKLNAGEKDRFEAAHFAADKRDFRARTVAHCVFDERGARLFDDDDISTISMMDPELLDPIVTAALKLNGFTKEDQDELRKNLNGQAVHS